MKEKNVLKILSQIIDDLQNQDLETVTEVLNHYCENPIEEDGVTYHPYNDPKLAARINARYNELTGEDHPTFLEQSPKVIDGLMHDRDMLLQAGAYTEEYFEQLKQIKDNLNRVNDSEKER